MDRSSTGHRSRRPANPVQRGVWPNEIRRYRRRVGFVGTFRPAPWSRAYCVDQTRLGLRGAPKPSTLSENTRTNRLGNDGANFVLQPSYFLLSSLSTPARDLSRPLGEPLASRSEEHTSELQSPYDLV